MKVERGVMVIKDGKAWGQTYSDGKYTDYGWMDLEDAPIHDPKYVKSPSSVTWLDSPYLEELESAEIVHVRRERRVFFEVD